ncbi:hypothetical protein [Bradyrhizobium sp. SZCCHNR3015]|uniref:hypothetical protein n=1 Tax=Bradyrhizobium sp. SZCCHNR3015 TaxID=3057395 RepID=UPI002915C6F0|nr:hypothetical protein [Bradyrhizobium sp. SZCCHNR3015]
MSTDVLSLGGIAFDSYSTPGKMPFGGKQAMVVHKLPGGKRVTDTLGPDERNIAWEGKFFGPDALATVLAIDGMRAAGQVVPLTFAGQTRQVIIEEFLPDIRRLPNWVEYSISCLVQQNPALGNLSGSPTASIDNLVNDDLGSAASAAGASGTAGIPTSSSFGNDFAGTSGLA